GWKITYAKASIPETVGDYSPYIQALLAGNPSMVYLLGTFNDASKISDGLKAEGFKGVIAHAIYSPLLTSALSGTVATLQSAPPESAVSNPTMKKITDAVEAYKPGSKLSGLSIYGYLAADFFVKAVKKTGMKNLTPVNLQKVAAKMTYTAPKTAGPTPYPSAFQGLQPWCQSLLKSNGTTWDIAAPYSCSAKRYSTKGSPPSV